MCMREEITCPVCGVMFTAPPSHQRKFCSKPCMYVGRTKASEQLRANYRLTYAPDHPLRRDTPVVLSHRIALWDKIGEGPHTCFYCQKPVTWFPAENPEMSSLSVDHVDRDKKNNNPENLVPCCHACNMQNTHLVIRSDEDFITRSDGSRLRAIRSRCHRCSVEFLTAARAYGRPPRKYCSRECHRLRGTPVNT